MPYIQSFVLCLFTLHYEFPSNKIAENCNLGHEKYGSICNERQDTIYVCVVLSLPPITVGTICGYGNKINKTKM